MDTYFVGQILRVTVEFRDNAGDLADPTTLIFSHRVDQEDIETLTYGVDVELVKDSLGVYYTDLELVTAGTYAYRFLGGGAIENSVEDAFVVSASLAIEPLIEIQEAKAYLRTGNDDEDSLIHGMLLAIEAVIKENLASFLIAEEESIYLDGGTEFLLLGKYPISVADDEEILIHDDIYDIDVSSEFYRLVPTTGQVFYLNEAGMWPTGKKRYIVTFTSGFSLRNDYTRIIRRIKQAELMWLADMYYNRKASTYKDVIDDTSENYELLDRLPKKIEAMLQGLLSVTLDL